MANRNEVKLGDLARDRMTGFEGIVTGITGWLNACRRIGIQPRLLDKDGNPREAQWFDEPQVDVLETAAFPGLNPEGVC